MRRRRLTAVHDHHEADHALIRERVAAFRAVTGRRAVGTWTPRHREAHKLATDTVAGHLICCHGWRPESPRDRRELEPLEVLHDRFHGKA